MTTLKLGIASYDDFKVRTMAIARSELTPDSDEPKVWFPSAVSFAGVLSQKNRALLAAIAETHPKSLQALAEGPGGRSPTCRVP